MMSGISPIGTSASPVFAAARSSKAQSVPQSIASAASTKATSQFCIDFGCIGNLIATPFHWASSLFSTLVTGPLGFIWQNTLGRMF